MSVGQLFLGQNVRRPTDNLQGDKFPATPAQLKVKSRRGGYASLVGCIAKETAIRYSGFRMV